jgi:hypothetical protein
VYFVLLAAAIAILAGVVAVAMGWGGEMAASSRDLPQFPLWASTASDVAMMRLPAGLLGYQREATDQALYAISLLVADRDAEIARLRDELWRLGAPERGGPTAAGPEPLLAVGPPGGNEPSAAIEVAGAIESSVAAEPPAAIESAPPS